MQHTVACTDVAMQRRDKTNKQQPYLGNGAVNMFPRQQIHMQQLKNSVFCVVRAQKL
jgi:hypothetical protein